MAEIQSDLTEKKSISITDFIENNHRLITIIGVFGGLSSFSLNFNNYYLTFSSLSIFLLLCNELWFAFPKNEIATMRMSLFEGFFVMFVLSIFGYIISFTLGTNDSLLQLIFVGTFIFIPIFYFVIHIGKDFQIYKKIRLISQKSLFFSPIVRSLAFFILLEIAILITILIIWLYQNYLH